MNTLSKVPSEALRQALFDLEKVENSDEYKVDMSFFHDPYENRNKCTVCFAGAAMAGTLSSDTKSMLYPEKFEEHETMLWALSDIALLVFGGSEDLPIIIGEELTSDLGEVYPNKDGVLDGQYSNDPKAFKQRISDTADFLESRGH